MLKYSTRKRRLKTDLNRDTMNYLKCKMVRPAGFEPTTPWFEAKYSNPLSYGRAHYDQNRGILTDP